MSERNESDRLQDESWIQRMMRRPEIGSFIVMIIIILALGLASEGKAFNALGLKNNINYCPVRNNCSWGCFVDDCWRI